MSDGIKIVSENKKAFHNYSFEEKFEAGIVLKGTEVKSLREGTVNIRDSYAVFSGRELFLINAHLSPYKMGNRENHDPLRSRKLLLHRHELDKIWGKAEIRGYALIPLKVYFKKGKVKVEIGIGVGKKLHDKRASIKEREGKRELDRLRKKSL